MTTTIKADRLVTLDGIRGLSAIVVALLHASAGRWPIHGYLAVDLFFLLSGFVLAGAFEQKLRDGMTMGAFMRARLARLYPLFVLGLVLGLSIRPNVPAPMLVGMFGANLFFVPAFFSPIPFGIDPPIWSLSLEMLINVAFAAGLWRLPTRALAVLAGCAGALLVAGDAIYGHTNFGFQSDLVGYTLGVARIGASFPIGWLIWRLRDRLVLRLAAPLAIAAILVCYIAPENALVGPLAAFCIFPVAMIALIHARQPVGVWRWLCDWSGRLSYPLYITHASVIVLVRAALHDTPAAFPLALAASFLVALAAHRSFEPLGRRLILNWRWPSLALTHQQTKGA